MEGGLSGKRGRIVGSVVEDTDGLPRSRGAGDGEPVVDSRTVVESKEEGEKFF